MHNVTAGLYATARKATDQDIHDRIFEAILARRLRPGARLGEEELARLFGVSRTKVRHAIAKLAGDGVVEVRRNHGATVAAPSRGQARQVMAFRRMIEPPVAAALAACCPAGLPEEMHAHVAAEHAARGDGDDARLIQLTGTFHLRLAELHGNALITRSLREAEALTCLSILSYGRPNAAACLPGEHDGIVAAVAAGDAPQAAALMLHHLLHVEAEMDLAEIPRSLATALDAA